MRLNTRIAIVAPGGVGGFFGALLARAGEDVAVVARGAHLRAIQQNGLRLEGPHGDFSVRVRASDDAATLGLADVVIFAVKLFQVEAAVDAARPLFGPDTVGISLLNGVDGAEMISGALPGAVILGGSAYMSAMIAAPGHIRYTSDMSKMVVGQPAAGGAALRTITDFVASGQRAGFAVELSADVRAVLWGKLVGLSAGAAITTASRRPVGDLYHDPETLEVVAALMAEAAAVGRHAGVQLPPGVEAEWLARFKGFPPGLYASMYYDLASGNPIEVDGFSGHIVREGKRLGVPTPHHAALYAVLKPHRNGAPELP